jgi:hypothetical protein
MSHARAIVLIVCAAALTACGKTGDGEDTDAQYGAAATLLASKDNGLATLIKRLHENLRVESGVVIVDGPIVPGAVVQSKNSSWSVSCGEGLTINVGKGEIDLLPAALQITETQCAHLTKRLGIEVQAIIDNR